ncbi:MAG TPA: TraR/DksA C4-type zinc finger protein [Ktedonobacterales bacterium]|nr:TraR/DksA C4-type zinc finger protein [Ktedonobacterales bacterium]
MSTMKTTLSPMDLMDLRALLECERVRLREQIAALREAEGSARFQSSLQHEEVTDQADQAMDQAEWDRMHIEELALFERLTEVGHALAKFQAGRYGLCEQCSQPIPTARLRALPEARFDIEHESALEQRIHAEEDLPERF